MAYLVNTPRAASLTINGIDYTANLKSFTVSDDSAYNNGAIITSGTIILGQVPAGESIEDYDRSKFKRGHVVTLDVLMPDRTTVRHPRGYLYVLGTSWNPEGPELVVDVTCKLGLGDLNDDTSDIAPLVSLFLDPTERRFENYSAALATEGKIAWVDNTGAVQSESYFNGDTPGGIAASQWTSVLGQTAISATPLTGSGAVPDTINLSYAYLSGSRSEDTVSRVDTTVTTSRYPLKYPAKSYTRVNPDGTIGGAGSSTYAPAEGSRTISTCGDYDNIGNGDGGNGDATCNENYEITPSTIIENGVRIQTATNYYYGTGGQLSRTESVTVGPIVEASGQYFADLFTFCRQQWATNCVPNGNCSTAAGMAQKTLGIISTVYTYGPDGQVAQSIQEQYVPKIRIATPDDWRAGQTNGIINGFQDRSDYLDELIRVAVTVTTTTYESNGSTSFTQNYATAAESGIGTLDSYALDAYNGTLSTEKRVSKTVSSNPERPDQALSPRSETTSDSTELPLFTGRYVTPPAAAGPYITDAQAPSSFIYPDGSPTTIEEGLATYSDYLVRFVKGDALGMNVVEALRNDVVTNWKPNMPFRYADNSNSKILAFRMNATTWGVDQEEAIVSTEGVWMGFTDGTIINPSNLLGNSTPDMVGSSPTPPTNSPGSNPAPPSIGGETSVDSGALAFVINVDIGTKVTVDLPTATGTLPSLPSLADSTFDVYRTFTCYVTGAVVEPGDLLGTGVNGSIPASYNGSLIAQGATIIDDDVFA